MKTTSCLLLLSLLLFACTNPEETTPSPLTEGEWSAIFNGEDLSGWETMGQLETEVKNGELHIHASHPNNNAWVLTEDSYRDFELQLEFKMPDTTANSGVLVRFDKNKEGKPNRTAYEANIDWRMDHQNPMGTLENASRADVLEKADTSGWNSMHIIARGDHLVVVVNDKKVAETHNRRSLEGCIGLQVPIHEGDDIAFRNIRLKPLSVTVIPETTLEEDYRQSAKPMQAMIKGQSLEGWYEIGPGKWTLEGEVLHGYSGATPSFIITDESYKDFYMKFEFRIEKEDNSGVFIRKSPDSTQVTVQDAIECNIYDSNGPAHLYSTGSIAVHARAWYDLIDHREWNEMEIFARNEHLVLYINGKKSAEAHLPPHFNKPGQIALQAGTRIFTDNEPSDIYFRKLMIKNMDASQ